MDFPLIGILIRLRYRLLWAKTRSRNGKLALFIGGYLLFVMAMVVLAAAGLAGGAAAIRVGKAASLASILLTGIWGQGVLTSVILGFGMTAIFSEAELRRYPLRARERSLTRHCIGLADPFWILFFILEMAVAFGLFLFGEGSFWMGTVAGLLLFVSNYAASRVLATLVDRLMSKRGGSVVLMVSVMCLGMAPSALRPLVHKNSPVIAALKRLWQATPPAGAVAAMTSQGIPALSGLGLIVLWTVALVAALVALERKPVKRRAAETTKIVWDSRIDRFGAAFGPRYGPLMAHWLRFYARNNRFRTIYPLALPLVAYLVLVFGRQAHFGGQVVNAVAGFLVLGFVGTGQFAVNQFGYVGGGFRRFLLLPTDPAAALRAGSYLFVVLNAALIPLAVLAWILFPPMPGGAPLVALLVSSSLFGLFAIHGVSLWTSVLGPRRGNYYHAMGNDLSAAGNLVVIGGMLVALFLPHAVEAAWPGVIVAHHWWAAALLAAAAAVFYAASLNAATALFRRRREALMVLLEGRG